MKTLLLEKPSAKKTKKKNQPTKLLLSTSVFKTALRGKNTTDFFFFKDPSPLSKIL
jgi:hypothetical protein